VRLVLTVLAAVLLTAEVPYAATGDPAVDALVDKLVQKGVMTREDARELEKELEKELATEPAAQGKPASGQPASQVPAEGKLASGQQASQVPPEKPSKPKLPFEIKVRAQARLDVGDLLVDDDDRYRTESDLFLRRVRLEVDKTFEKPPVGKELKLNLTLEADRFDQEFRGGEREDPDNDVGLQYLYGDWTFRDALAVQVGQYKLPFLRIELTSSARQLLIERPAATGEAKESFGDYEQPNVMVHGEVAEGAVRYYLSYADGAGDLGSVQRLDGEATAAQRRAWGKAYIGRLELARGFSGEGQGEKKKDDTGIGEESHITLGIDGGFQRNLRYETEEVADAELDSRVFSVDLAGRYRFAGGGTVTAQAAYIDLEREFNYRGSERPKGFFLQGGYLLPVKVLGGQLEPAARYEWFDRDRIENEGAGGTKERTVSLGFNHYLQKHSIKWAYNFVWTRFDEGVAEAAEERNRQLHQIQWQLYF
jgi:hypothetical protein